MTRYYPAVRVSTELKQATWRKVETWSFEDDAFANVVFTPEVEAISWDGRNWWRVYPDG